MARKIVWIFIVVGILFGGTGARSQDTLAVDTNLMHRGVQVGGTITADSISVAKPDTITPKILRARDSADRAQWLDSLDKGYGFGVFSLSEQMKIPSRGEVALQQGAHLPRGNVWVLAVVGFIVVAFAILKNVFAKQLAAIVHSFYSNRALVNLNKEDNLVTSWPFLFLFVLFGFTIGMYVYLVAQYKELPEADDGFSFFVSLSVGILVLYLLKIIALRLLGFIFEVQRALHQYISILYLSYFNTSLLFIPIVIAFALSPSKYAFWYVLLGISVLVLVFVFQFIRAAISILPQYRFPKLYLFLYFCTLEFCPILILVKIIGL